MTAPYLPAELALRAIDDPLASGFFEACKRHELTIQRCDACDTFQHPARAVCSSCLSEQLSWKPVGDTGRIYTYTVVHHPIGPVGDRVPFNVVSVELDGAPGIRLLSNLIGTEPEDIAIGSPVRVVWEQT